jgi:hypothetical protein
MTGGDLKALLHDGSPTKLDGGHSIYEWILPC